MDCCENKNNDSKKEESGFLNGIAYGIIPHIGCILFIVAAILGTTALMQFFKPLLMNRNLFYYMIAISIGFATLSSFLYLKKNKLLSWEGIKKKKGYLSIMYGSTIGINILLFLFIFPLVANLGNASAVEIAGSSVLSISVDIPCSGHASLITNEVKTIAGVKGSEYSFPNKFDIYYDSTQTTGQEILSLEVFNEYPATEIKNSQETITQTSEINSQGSCSTGCGGCGSCGSASCGGTK